MEITGSNGWLQNVRAAVRQQKAEALAPGRTAAPALPDPPRVQPGLRSLADTQDLEALEDKGRIINRYL